MTKTDTIDGETVGVGNVNQETDREVDALHARMYKPTFPNSLLRHHALHLLTLEVSANNGKARGNFPDQPKCSWTPLSRQKPQKRKNDTTQTRGGQPERARRKRRNERARKGSKVRAYNLKGDGLGGGQGLRYGCARAVSHDARVSHATAFCAARALSAFPTFAGICELRDA